MQRVSSISAHSTEVLLVMAKQKRRYKWVGVQDVNDIKTFVSISVANVTVCAAPIVDGDIQADCMVERVLIGLNVRRLLTTTIEALGYIVAKQKFDSSGVLLQVLDPLSTDVFDFGNKDIMAMGRLPVAGNISVGNAAGVQVSKGIETPPTIDIKVRRKLERMTEGITLTIVGDVSDVVRVSLFARVLLSFR